MLVSFEGDADLYVSSKTQFVDYTNYELQSTTYGVDEVLLSHDMKRPVYISVYAHPYYVKSVYKLYQYAIPSNTFVDNEYNHFDNAKRQSESSYDDHVKVLRYFHNTRNALLFFLSILSIKICL